MSDSQFNSESDQESQQLEQLVSWLDSELDDEQTQEMELRLRKDAGLRRQADALDRAWGMLDTLEPVSADDQFTMQTVQIVYANTGDPAERRSAKSDRRLAAVMALGTIFIWFCLGVSGTALGLLLARLAAPAEDTTRDMQILNDMELLSRYPEYSVVRNVELLRQLGTPPDEKDPAGAPAETEDAQ